MSTTGSTASRPTWQSQHVSNVAPANWDQQLDSLLSDLDKAAPGTSVTNGTSNTSSALSGAVVPSRHNTTLPSTASLGGNEDFHERQEFTSPDQSTRTVEERSRRTARTNEGVVTHQTFKSETSSSHPAAAKGSVPATGASPQIEVQGTDIPDITTIFPDANTPLAPGQKRIIKYDVRKTHQRSVSPQPPPVPQSPSLYPSQRALPPPAASKPYPQSPQSTLPPASPLSETYRSYSSTNERANRPPTLERPGVSSPEPVPVPPVQPGSNTTINYHIYNYGGTGPDGLPLEGAPPPTAPPKNVNTIERHETREQRVINQPGSPNPTPSGPYSQPGSYPHPATAPGSNTIERYETRQYTSQTADSPQGQPQTPQTSGPYTSYPAGPYSPPPGLPSSRTNTIERYETRHQTHNTTTPRAPSPYDNPPQMAPPPSQRSPATAAPPNGWPQQQPPADGYHTRTVSHEVERTHTMEGGGSFPPAGAPQSQPETLVSRYPQDAIYPDGPVRRDLTSSQMAPPSEAEPEVTSPTKSQPGVYYPPEGLNADHKWKSSEKTKNGNTKTRFEAEGRYKAKGGSKQKEDKGGKTIPICLPLCGGAACSVM